METQPTSQIACVDTMDGGVLVEFEDGRCAFYSGSLLRAILPQTVEFEGTDNDDSDERTQPPSELLYEF